MKWFAAIYLLSESKKGMSALRTLKVAYKTAWHLCHRIREAVKDEANCDLLGLAGGIVECDETYLGGKAIYMHRSKLKNMKKSTYGYDNKRMVLGAIERGGKVRLSVGPKPATRKILHAFIKSKLAEETALIVTDEHKGYLGIGDDTTLHATVDHSKNSTCAGSFTLTRWKRSGRYSSDPSSAPIIRLARSILMLP